MAAAEGCGGSRDDALHEAALAGLGITRIQKIGGLGTTTIMQIPGRWQPARGARGLWQAGLRVPRTRGAATCGIARRTPFAGS
jgi:hypothetical protein